MISVWLVFLWSDRKASLGCSHSVLFTKPKTTLRYPANGGIDLRDLEGDCVVCMRSEGLRPPPLGKLSNANTKKKSHLQHPSFTVLLGRLGQPLVTLHSWCLRCKTLTSELPKGTSTQRSGKTKSCTCVTCVACERRIPGQKRI